MVTRFRERLLRICTKLLRDNYPETAMPRTIERVYHLVDTRNWVLIQEHGLMSTRRLMEISGEPREALRRHRTTEQRLLGGAVIRDQRPMPPQALKRCLKSGLRPEDWFELINSKVFFWLDHKRLNRQRLACGSAPQIALVIDAIRLLDTYGAQASVSPINTGNAMRAPAPRNRSTFVPYQRWLVDGWTHEDIPGIPRRAVNHRPVELTVDCVIPDIMDYIIATIPLHPQETLNSTRL
jgi:hypothetical protein